VTNVFLLIVAFLTAAGLHSDAAASASTNRFQIKQYPVVVKRPLNLAAFTIAMQKYKHKSEAEIARMTPAQRVEEYAEELVHHKYDVLDDQGELIEKFIWHDGLKALPRMIEIMDEYDPTRAAGRRGHRGERFDAMWMLLADLDRHVVRLRGWEQGQRAMEALERAIHRMGTAGYGKKGQHDWERHGRFDLAVMRLEDAKGINSTDDAIKDTLRLEYKVLLSKEELLAFSNYLVARDPTYPAWSKTNRFRDYTQINDAGNPLWVHTMKKPERFYEAYLEFKKQSADKR